MTRYIKTKDGKFAGSIGAGKTNIPRPAPAKPVSAELTDDELASIGLGASHEARHSATSLTTTIPEAHSMLDAMVDHHDDATVANTWLDNVHENPFEHDHMEVAVSIERVRRDLALARLHLEADTTPASVEDIYADNLHQRAHTAWTQVNELHDVLESSERIDRQAWVSLDAAQEICHSPVFQQGLRDVDSLSDHEQAEFAVNTSQVSLLVKHARANTDPDSGGVMQLPGGIGVLSQAACLGSELDETRELLSSRTISPFAQASPKVTNALGHIRDAHAAHFDLPWNMTGH